MPSIHFKMQKQEHSNWCWAAVAASVDHFFSKKSNWCQCRLATRMAKIEKLKVETCGNCGTRKPMHQACNQPWYLQDALKIVRRLKGKPQAGPLSFAKIWKTIESGRPVCLEISWGKRQGAHFIVISGCVKGPNGERWVDVEDPHAGTSTWLYDEFRSNYQYVDGKWIYSFPMKRPK